MTGLNPDGLGKSERFNNTESESVRTERLGIEGQWIDIRDHGAVADGDSDKTENTQAIIDAINEADSTGADVVVPPGDFYYASEISLSGITDVTIRGFGRDSVLRHDDVDAHGIVLTNVKNVDVERLRHLGNPNTTTKQQGIDFLDASENCTVEGCYLEDWGGDPVVWRGTNGTPCKNISVKNCVIVNYGDDGINPGSQDGCEGGVVEGNRVLDGGDSGRNGAGVGIHVSVNAQGVTVRDNWIEGVPIGIDFVTCAENEIVGNVIKDVDGSGIEANAGTASNTFSNVVRENLIISPGSYGVNIGDFGVDHVIEKNTIRDTSDHGIRIASDGTEISHNRIDSPGGQGIDTPGNNPTLTIRGNKIESESGYGINGCGDGSSIEGNKIEGAGRGIQVDSKSDVTIEGNTIRSASDYGIVWTGGGTGDGSIKDNHVTGSVSNDGIFVNVTGIIVADNRLPSSSIGINTSNEDGCLYDGNIAAGLPASGDIGSNSVFGDNIDTTT